jgi:hypothetical protein
LDLLVELPRSTFKLAITREAEFEIPPIPSRLAALKTFIRRAIDEYPIKTDIYFGFGAPDLPPSEQRVAGFDFGRFASSEESAFIAAEIERWRRRGAKPKTLKTKLSKDEADISLGARSLHHVVITLDAKPGPLTRARHAGGRVVFLTDFDASGLSLREFIERGSKV